MARISVVIATYNGAAYIWEQIDSLLKVLSSTDEIVVSDDLSTDGTREIVEEIKDRRIVILSTTERLGYQGNFERAISHASGDYIFFSDQDDICLPRRIEASMEALESYGCVIGDAIVTDATLRVTNDSYFGWRSVSSFSAHSLFVKPAAIGATLACSRRFLHSALPFPRKVPHDQWMSILAAARGELYVIKSPLILYRRHSNVASLTGLDQRRPFLLIAAERARLFYALFRWLVSCTVRSSKR